jgi:hypothetical protein
MIRDARDHRFIIVDRNDSVDDAHGNAFARQNAALFNMKFQIGMILALFDASLFQARGVAANAPDGFRFRQTA